MLSVALRMMNKNAKLQWRCRRGMLELDLVLTRFLGQSSDVLTEDEITVFEQLLECTDPQLYAWLMGFEQPNREFCHIVNLIRSQHPL